MFMFGSFVSCFNSFHMTTSLTSVYTVTHTLPSLFPHTALGCLRWFNWPLCSCISSATFSVFRSFGVAYVFAQAHVFLQLVISLLLVFVKVLPITFQCLIYIFKVICFSCAAFSSFVLDLLWRPYSLKRLPGLSLTSSMSIKVSIFHLQCHIPFSLIAFLNQSPAIHPVACISFSVVNDGSDGKILSFFFRSILISWVASIFLVFLALIFYNFLLFAILTTSGLLSSVSWWAYKGYSKNLFVCFIVPLLCTTFLHKKKNQNLIESGLLL